MITAKQQFALLERKRVEMFVEFLWMQQESKNPITLEDARAMVVRNPGCQWILDYCLQQATRSDTQEVDTSV